MQGRSISGPLQGLAQTGWQRAKATSPGAVPVLDLNPRAGRGPAQAAPHIVAWVVPPPSRHGREGGVFVARVSGDSMLPVLSNGQWCLFSKQFSGDELLGKVCLVRETEPSGLTAWSVKRVTRLELGAQDQLRLQLSSLNPAYPPREVVIDAGGDVSVEAVLREPLGSAASSLPPHPAAKSREGHLDH